MNKITIIGAGMVGSTAAYSIIAKNFTEEIALIDIDEKLALAQTMDLQHSAPFFGSTRVKVGSYEDIRDSRIVVLCAGVAQKEGETRLDLIKKNSAIVREIVPIIFSMNPDAILVIVTNPVDILTYIAIQCAPDKKHQILGTGTLLDSARFRHLLGEKLSINPQSIHAYIIGEHGDSELPFWSAAVIGSMHIDTCEILSSEEKEVIFDQAKNAAYSIIAGKQATYYAIGAGVAHLCNAIIDNKRLILPVSHLMEGEFGISDMCLSVPVIVGKEGVSGSICIKFSEKEQEQLHASAETLKKALREMENTETPPEN